MHDTITVLVGLLICFGAVVLFFIVEMAAVQRGYDSWDWSKRLYSKYKFLQNIHW